MSGMASRAGVVAESADPAKAASAKVPDTAR
jgi:hypothetical protein